MYKTISKFILLILIFNSCSISQISYKGYFEKKGRFSISSSKIYISGRIILLSNEMINKVEIRLDSLAKPFFIESYKDDKTRIKSNFDYSQLETLDDLKVVEIINWLFEECKNKECNLDKYNELKMSKTNSKKDGQIINGNLMGYRIKIRI
tara:strand:- start:3178 stop:3630 length:453 start_codon:yes stop_codon:yes gene_type:complete